MGGVLEGDLYAAEDWTVPMDREIRLSVSLTDGETIRTASLETLEGCGADCFQRIEQVHFGGGALLTSLC